MLLKNRGASKCDCHYVFSNWAFEICNSLLGRPQLCNFSTCKGVSLQILHVLYSSWLCHSQKSSSMRKISCATLSWFCAAQNLSFAEKWLGPLHASTVIIIIVNHSPGTSLDFFVLQLFHALSNRLIFHMKGQEEKKADVQKRQGWKNGLTHLPGY